MRPRGMLGIGDSNRSAKAARSQTKHRSDKVTKWRSEEQDRDQGLGGNQFDLEGAIDDEFTIEAETDGKFHRTGDAELLGAEDDILAIKTGGVVHAIGGRPEHSAGCGLGDFKTDCEGAAW